MAVTLLLIAIIVLPIFAYFFFTNVFSFFRKRLQLAREVDKIPGPPAIPLLGNTHQFKLDKVEFSYQLESLCKQYGSNGIFRIWMGPYPIVMLTNAEAAEPLLSSTTLITKSEPGYRILKQWIGDGLLISTGAKWKSRRRMLTPTFHFSILNRFVEIHGEQAAILVERLKPMADQGNSFDIFPYIGRAALDVMCESAMGVSVNAQKETKSEYVKAVQTMSDIIFKHERMPWLQIKPIWYLLGYGSIYDRCIHLLKGFTRNVIEQRSAQLRKLANEQGTTVSQLKLEGGKRQAFLDLLLMMQEENRLTFEDIAEEVDTFMFEGHDTTASGMGWSIFLLGHHPDVQEKIYEEMERIFGDSDRLPTSEDLKEMRYLEQAVKEAMRLYPPVPLFGRSVTEDFYTAGYTVPKGATVFAIPLMIHRDREQFGENPDAYDPDRFDPKNQGRRHPFSYVPFSAGSRNCIGQKFALMEEKVILSQIVRNYRIQSLEDRETLQPIPDIILRPPERFLVRITPRK